MGTVTGLVLSAKERTVLEAAVLAGRDAAERAAEHEVSRLGVSQDKVPGYLNDDERILRRELREKARQLGDSVVGGNVLPLLVADIAYEQWHRLLFAKFLEMNGLLIHPGMGMSVTLEECAELAADVEDADGWSVAVGYASETLPGVFRQTDPCFRIRLAPEDLQKLERVIVGLNSQIYRCEDALGWVYQFWQTKRKKQINDAGNKVGGADLSPVTQLFTENYMVRFLLENSLGAWWAARHPESPLIGEWDYLRASDDGTPEVGGHEQWPARAADVTVMDPCCGSGHFLVATFGMLWRMRAEEEGLTPAQAQDAVLKDNLFGLELDPRCTQLATFNLVLEAWKQGGYRTLPAPNLACSGVPIRASGSEWEDLAGADEALRGSLSRLHSQFRNADTLGSLINPVGDAVSAALLGRTGLLESTDWDKVALALEAAVADEQVSGTVLGDTVNDIARAAQLLSRQYSLVVTNPPYLMRASMSPDLQSYIDAHHPVAKGDLATAFLERCFAFAGNDGLVVTVSPQNWTLLTSYTQFRRDLLGSRTLEAIARLGHGAFRQITGHVVKVVLTIIQPSRAAESHLLMGVRAQSFDGPDAKAQALISDPVAMLTQRSQLQNPDHRITASIVEKSSLLASHADGLQGIATADYPRFGRFFWERPLPHPDWNFQQSTVSSIGAYGGREHIVWWEAEQGALSREKGAYIRGRAAWGKCGVAVSQMGKLPVSLYTGELFDNNTAVILPKDEKDLPAIWAFCSSPEFNESVREIDDVMKVTNATLVKVPFDVERWRSVASTAGPLPEPESNDVTQWLFPGVLEGSTEPLQVAVARLLGYTWPEQVDDGLSDLVDSDGIVCIPAVAGERSASDRLLELLARAYGEEWSSAKRDELLALAGGKPGDIEGWLRDKFFAHHLTTFQNKPFVWQVWDGRKDGFSALLNYHTLTKSTLEKLTYTVLGTWISRQREDASGGQVGADERLRAAETLQQKLGLILQGEAPHDIYVRWKDLADQPIGWDPDLDDGVRLNLRPFVTAGVLRSRINVKWEMDRGKNSDGTDRINDLHLTLQEKHSSRG
ncbi:BREX-1 system adenine-specific DNA-methyltransferase PglX [Pseudarthrobacter sp. MDT3-26]|uniref:Eco57I restriction-modification methylase domain-containing protein n=1 Tax=Pseudarthrobacter raffinosi TaxID=2953651 RepID=UPI00208E42DE|nr:N-6 DNA methylase [Pseudarthrobacter sp. MDT3-26]MCO4261479.1 BREX-1 system adenine-specific DNA-methyltransferase PglX [Pseudarthrobacter sp. MDT3-26]